MVAGQAARDIVDDAVPGRILARQDTGPVRRTQRHGVKCACQRAALNSQPIDMGRLDVGVARRSQFIPTQVVDDDRDDIGSWAGFARRRRSLLAVACYAQDNGARRKGNHRVLHGYCSPRPIESVSGMKAEVHDGWMASFTQGEVDFEIL